MQAVALTGFLSWCICSPGCSSPSKISPLRFAGSSNLVWGRYYIEIVRDALLAGGGWPSVWPKVLAIGAIGSFFYTIAWRSMRRMQVKD